MTMAVIAFTRRGTALGRRLADALGGTLHVPARFAPEVGAEPPCSALAGWTARAWHGRTPWCSWGRRHRRAGHRTPCAGTSSPTPPWSAWTRRGGGWCLSSPATWGAPTTWPGGSPPSPADRRRCPPPPTSTVCSPWTCGPRGGASPLRTDRVRPRRSPPPCWTGKAVGFLSDFPVHGALPEGVTTGPAGWGSVLRPEDGGAAVRHRACGWCPGALGWASAAVGAWPEADHRRRRGRRPGGPRASPEAVAGVATVGLEGRVRLACLLRPAGLPLRCYSAEALAAVEGDFTPSAFVRGITGVDNVCERAAAAAGGRIIVPKQANNGVTAAGGRGDL